MQKNKQTSFTSIINIAESAIPTYRQSIFRLVIISLITGYGAKCMASIVRSVSFLSEFSTKSNKSTQKRFYSFLQSEKIRWDFVWKAIIYQFHDTFLYKGKLILSLDDSTNPKSGKKISHCDTHFDHAAKMNQSKYVWGHCRVVIGAQVKIFERWVLLPIAFAHYKPKSDEKDNTKIRIACDLIERIRSWFPDQDLSVVCDSWFGNKSLMDQLNKRKITGITVLSRLRKSSRLHNPTIKKQIPGKRGRKPKYGKRLPSLKRIAKALRKRSARIFVYGKERTICYQEFVCLSHAMKCKIKVVLIRRNNGSIYPIFTTDLSMEAVEMIHLYAGRWKIESAFKELKHELGALDNQARKESSVKNHFEMTMFAMTLAWIHCSKQCKAPERRFPTSRSTSFAFSDVRDQIRNEYRQQNLIGICSESIKAAKIFIYNQFTALAA